MVDISQAQIVNNIHFRYSGLVVESTNRCTAKCAMCYQSSGPKGSDQDGAQSLSREVIEKCIREATEIEGLERRFHLAGGEAFMNIGDCLHWFNVAKESGYQDITGTTNAFWAKKKVNARNIARELRKSGLTTLEISWDFWHSEYVPALAIDNCIRACFENDIEVNLRILNSKSHRMSESLLMLSKDSIALANRVTSGPIFATGRAEKEIAEADFYHSRSGCEGACHTTLNLSINSSGEVFPCCAGLDQTIYYKFGNINNEGVIDIVKRMESDPILRRVVFRGASSLLSILESAGIDLRKNNKENFFSMCHLCWKVFTSEEAVSAIKKRKERTVLRSIKSTVSAIEASLE